MAWAEALVEEEFGIKNDNSQGCVEDERGIASACRQQFAVLFSLCFAMFGLKTPVRLNPPHSDWPCETNCPAWTRANIAVFFFFGTYIYVCARDGRVNNTMDRFPLKK